MHLEPDMACSRNRWNCTYDHMLDEEGMDVDACSSVRHKGMVQKSADARYDPGGSMDPYTQRPASCAAGADEMGEEMMLTIGQVRTRTAKENEVGSQ